MISKIELPEVIEDILSHNIDPINLTFSYGLMSRNILDKVTDNFLSPKTVLQPGTRSQCCLATRNSAPGIECSWFEAPLEKLKNRKILFLTEEAKRRGKSNIAWPRPFCLITCLTSSHVTFCTVLGLLYINDLRSSHNSTITRSGWTLSSIFTKKGFF